MLCDWRPAHPAFVDFETRSDVDLKTRTVSQYAFHPSTQVLCAVVKVDGEEHRFGPTQVGELREYLTNLDCTLVAHNAPFDSAVCEGVLGVRKRWCDTLPMARAAGLPGRLELLGQRLLGRGKDPNGKRLVEMMNGVHRVPDSSPAYRLLIEYCAKDVELLEAVYGEVAGFGEPDVMTVDRVVNDRGVPVDRDVLAALVSMNAFNKEVQGAAFAAATAGVNPNSPKQVVEWLRRQGFEVSGISRYEYKNLVARPEDFFVGDSEADAAFSAVHDALELRREVARVGAGKAKAATEVLEDDGRVRDQFVYWGAGPGRWSSRRLQLHNMPRPSNEMNYVDARSMPMTYEGAVEAARVASEKSGKHVLVADVLNLVLRHIVRAPALSVADYGAVEAHALAWVADDERMLEIFRDPHKSLYIDMGRVIFGRTIDKKLDPDEYVYSKAIILGCGYGMSGAKFEWLNKMRGLSEATLRKAGLTAKESVALYRRTYPRIPQVWKEYNEAVHAAVAGEERVAGKCLFYRSGEDLVMRLPSSREVVYRDARVEMLVPGYVRLYNMPEERVPTVTYANPRGYRGFLYGSKVCENACQGICRDLLAESLVEWEKQGMDPCLHVHDEGCCETDELDGMCRVMSTPPEWAAGFPVLVEGCCGPVWTKQTKGYRETVYLDGRRVE